MKIKITSIEKHNVFFAASIAVASFLSQKIFGLPETRAVLLGSAYSMFSLRLYIVITNWMADEAKLRAALAIPLIVGKMGLGLYLALFLAQQSGAFVFSTIIGLHSFVLAGLWQARTTSDKSSIVTDKS